MRYVLFGVGLALWSCSPPEPPPASSAGHETPAASQAPSTSTGTRAFGGDLDPATPEVALASLLEQPAEYVGQVVRTAGTVERVCQRKGCWMELTADGYAGGLRVPMAGHAFFLPQDIVGHRAEAQGTLSARPLPQAVREHVQSEGAQQLGPLSLAATAVRVDP